MPRNEQPMTITDEAVEAILGVRDREPDAADLALRVAIGGVNGLDFAYELTFVPRDDAGDDDVATTYGDLPVVIPADSVEHLQGAGLHIEHGGLAIDNPNSPIPRIEAGGVAATGTVAERVDAVLRTQINPAISGHGGWAELVSVDGGVVALRLGGGCQGCGMAAMTLRQGIERAIKATVPEVTEIVDVTDHASGVDPYY